MTDADGSAADAFRFAYDHGPITYGDGCVADLGTEVGAQGVERALVVCGQTVGSTPAVIDPVREGLGDRLAGVFAETTPEKRLATALDAVDAIAETDADAIVSLGGGSSLDTATVASALAAEDRPREAVYEEFVESGTVRVPEDPLPLFAVPTTLAGADLSIVAGISAHPDTDPVEERVGGGVSDPRLMPDGLFYDPELFATTPTGVLFASAMNGFDKGLETIYARDATPITDATASHGVSLFAEGLTGLGEDPEDREALRQAVQGAVLVQYGISRPDAATLSLIHAFGHALTAHYEVQQGAAHAVVAPHVLRYLFDRVDARRDLLADAFGVAREGQTPDERAEAVIGAVEEVRDALELPTRLRDVEGASRDDFVDLATYTLEDGFTGNGPEGVDHSVESLTDVLEAAW